MRENKMIWNINRVYCICFVQHLNKGKTDLYASLLSSQYWRKHERDTEHQITQLGEITVGGLSWSLKMIWWTAAFCWPPSFVQFCGLSSGRWAGRKARKVNSKNGSRDTASPNTCICLKVSFTQSTYLSHNTITFSLIFQLSKSVQC